MTSFFPIYVGYYYIQRVRLVTEMSRFLLSSTRATTDSHMIFDRGRTKNVTITERGQIESLLWPSKLYQSPFLASNIVLSSQTVEREEPELRNAIAERDSKHP